MINEVIDRLQQAQKGNWSLNCRIMVALEIPDDKDRCYISEFARALRGERPADWPPVDLDNELYGPVDFNNYYKNYTNSIDDAATLVPPDCDWLINSRGNYALVWESKETGRHGRWEGVAATLPLALCLACLHVIRIKQAAAPYWETQAGSGYNPDYVSDRLMFDRHGRRLLSVDEFKARFLAKRPDSEKK